MRASRLCLEGLLTSSNLFMFGNRILDQIRNEISDESEIRGIVGESKISQWNEIAKSHAHEQSYTIGSSLISLFVPLFGFCSVAVLSLDSETI